LLFENEAHKNPGMKKDIPFRGAFKLPIMGCPGRRKIHSQEEMV